MKHIFIAIILLSETAFCLSKPEALQQAKYRIDGLNPAFAQFAYTCFVYETDCDVTDHSQEVALKLILNEIGANKVDIRYSNIDSDFMIDGALRVAKTGSQWGSPVIFNENLLITDEGNGEYLPIGFMEILGILIHEFAHHQVDFMKSYGLRVLEHEELDILGAKVVYYLESRTRHINITSKEVPQLKMNSDLGIYFMDVEVNNGLRMPWSYVFIDSPLFASEISENILIGVSCPKKYKAGNLRFSGEPAKAYYKNVKAPVITVSGSQVFLKQEVSDTTVMCIDYQLNKFEVFNGYTNGVFKLGFTINLNGQLIYEPNLSSFTAKAPPDQYSN